MPFSLIIRFCVVRWMCAGAEFIRHCAFKTVRNAVFEKLRQQPSHAIFWYLCHRNSSLWLQQCLFQINQIPPLHRLPVMWKSVGSSPHLKWLGDADKPDTALGDNGNAESLSTTTKTYHPSHVLLADSVHASENWSTLWPRRTVVTQAAIAMLQAAHMMYTQGCAQAQQGVQPQTMANGTQDCGALFKRGKRGTITVKHILRHRR